MERRSFTAATRRFSTTAVAVFFAAVATAIGFYGIDAAPLGTTPIEADVIGAARGLMAGWDENSASPGPLFVPTPAFAPGREPIPVYAAAVSMRLFGLSPLAARLPTLLLGALNVVLIYLVARHFVDALVAAVAPMLLLTSPAHVMHARVVDPALYPLPFALAWLLLAATALSHGGNVRWLAAGASLGVGMYTHPAALIVMPVLLVATLIVALTRAVQRVRAAALTLVGFAVPLSLWAVWQLGHPDRIAALAMHYRLYDATHLNVAQGIRDMSSYFGLSVRSYLYWQYFSPSLWLYAGEPVEFASSRQVGALLLPAAILIGAGLYQLTIRRAPLDLLVLCAVLVAPIAAALEPSTVDLRRALTAVPFVVLIAVMGCEWLVQARRSSRVVLPALALFGVLQLAVFLSSLSSLLHPL